MADSDTTSSGSTAEFSDERRSPTVEERVNPPVPGFSATGTLVKRKEMTRRYSCSENSGVSSLERCVVNACNYPRVDVQEKIIICLDLSSEMDGLLFKSRAGDKFSPIKLLKRALSMFLHTKSKIDDRHEFAVVVFLDDAKWGKGFTDDPEEIISFLDDLTETSECDSFDLSSLFDIIYSKINLPTVEDPLILPPPFVCRAILLYGRSHCVPHFSCKETFQSLTSSPYFFVDAFYVHELPSDENQCEQVFDCLCNLDNKESSYIFEVSRNLTKVYDHMAKLLAHPFQRPYQKDLYYKIN